MWPLVQLEVSLLILLLSQGESPIPASVENAKCLESLILKNPGNTKTSPENSLLFNFTWHFDNYLFSLKYSTTHHHPLLNKQVIWSSISHLDLLKPQRICYFLTIFHDPSFLHFLEHTATFTITACSSQTPVPSSQQRWQWSPHCSHCTQSWGWAWR